MKNEHEFYMNIAVRVSKQSYCERNKIGAILVKNNNIISMGYNGTPYGFDNCCELERRNFLGIKEIYTKPEVLHAEANAILKCAKDGVSTEFATLYTTVSPCIECAKLIIQSGIIEVFYLYKYRDEQGLDLLCDSGIPVYNLPDLHTILRLSTDDSPGESDVDPDN